MKTTGKCPKCGSTEIYTNEKLSKRGERSILAVTSWVQVYVLNYVCLSCGYFEEYIEKLNEKELEKFKTEWNKINPH
ncbi:MAG: hypothetical protein EHM58_12795 [Ignavibacteriae bacterium]|nr:MAG: hypothetical protein EHM58_12795 [Ignavibacteriota bacterium]